MSNQVAKDYKKIKIYFTPEEFKAVLSQHPEMRFYISETGVFKTKYQFIPHSVVKSLAFEAVLAEQPDMFLMGSRYGMIKEIGDEFYEAGKKELPLLRRHAKTDAIGNTAFTVAAYTTISAYATVLLPMFMKNFISLLEAYNPLMGAAISFIALPIIFHKRISRLYKRNLKAGFSSEVLNAHWYANEKKIPWFTQASAILADSGFVVRQRWREKEFILSIRNEAIYIDVSLYKNQFKIILDSLDGSLSLDQLMFTTDRLASVINQALSIKCDRAYLLE